MFGLESSTRYFMCQHPVSMRKGIDSLFNLVVSESPMTGDVQLHNGRRPSFIKHIYHIHTLRCGDIIASGKAPSAPLQNSRFDGSFIAGIAELRYLYSMPVECIVKYFQGNGFDLDKQTAHRLLKKTADLFDNLYKAIRLAVKEGTYLNCDESYHTVLIKNEDGKGSKKGYIWVIACRCNGINFFDYFSDVLNKAADMPHLTPEACRNLLPDRWTKE